MNIFSLHPNPYICATLHCDQHLNKMILESAQIVSSAYHLRKYPFSPYLYKPAYLHHPCVQWAAQSPHNIAFLITLGLALNEERKHWSLFNLGDHSSVEPLLAIECFFKSEIPPICSNPDLADERPFCGPGHIALRQDRNLYEKYKLFYIYKAQKWASESGGLTGDKRMSYKGRPLPSFLQGNPNVIHTPPSPAILTKHNPPGYQDPILTFR